MVASVETEQLIQVGAPRLHTALLAQSGLQPHGGSRCGSWGLRGGGPKTLKPKISCCQLLLSIDGTSPADLVHERRPGRRSSGATQSRWLPTVLRGRLPGRQRLRRMQRL